MPDQQWVDVRQGLEAVYQQMEAQTAALEGIQATLVAILAEMEKSRKQEVELVRQATVMPTLPGCGKSPVVDPKPQPERWTYMRSKDGGRLAITKDAS